MLKKGSSPLNSTLVLLAALNEEKGIGPTIKEVKRFVETSSLLVVDGHSEDRTVEVAKNLDAEIICQSGKGKGDAIARAIELADFDGEYVVITDADFTYPAAFIPQMMQILDEDPRVGMVCGNRFDSHFHLRALGNMYYLGNRVLAFAHNMFNGVQLRDPLTGLRVVRWSILKGWKPKSNGFDIEVELNRHVEKRGYGIAEIPISYRPRLGEKKLKVRHGLIILKRIISESIC
jgi:glycosyltransferase involved in cell wall biosynthesis